MLLFPALTPSLFFIDGDHFLEKIRQCFGANSDCSHHTTTVNNHIGGLASKSKSITQLPMGVNQYRDGIQPHRRPFFFIKSFRSIWSVYW